MTKSSAPATAATASAPCCDLPWLLADGSADPQFKKAIEEVGHGQLSADLGFALMREVWENEASVAEKRLARRMKTRPGPFCEWALTGVHQTGVDPALAPWRAGQREKVLLKEFTRLWIPANGVKGWRATAKMVLFPDNPIGRSKTARLAAFALANVGLALNFAWLFVSLAGRHFFGKELDHGWVNLLPSGILAMIFLGMAIKLRALDGANSIPVWLWARRLLPLAGRAGQKKTKRAAEDIWRALGAPPRVARELSECDARWGWPGLSAPASLVSRAGLDAARDQLEAAEAALESAEATENAKASRDAELANLAASDSESGLSAKAKAAEWAPIIGKLEELRAQRNAMLDEAEERRDELASLEKRVEAMGRSRSAEAMLAKAAGEEAAALMEAVVASRGTVRAEASAPNSNVGAEFPAQSRESDSPDKSDALASEEAAEAALAKAKPRRL
jgi:hypothetical protein